jgi:hypothetical protein
MRIKSQPNHLKQVTSAVLLHSTSALLQHLPVDTAAAAPPCLVLTHTLQLHSAPYSPSRKHLGLAVNAGLDLSVTNQANQLLLQSTAALSNSSSSSSSSNSRSPAAHQLPMQSLSKPAAVALRTCHKMSNATTYMQTCPTTQSTINQRDKLLNG